MNWIMNFIVGKAKDYVLTNWKTTAIAAIGWLFAHVIAPKFGIGSEMQQTIMQMVTNFILPIGLVAKDADKSGTTEQPRTPPAVVAQQTASLRVAESRADDAEIATSLSRGG